MRGSRGAQTNASSSHDPTNLIGQSAPNDLVLFPAALNAITFSEMSNGEVHSVIIIIIYSFFHNYTENQALLYNQQPREPHQQVIIIVFFKQIILMLQIEHSSLE